MQELNLEGDVTLVCQDWGGLIGLRLVAASVRGKACLRRRPAAIRSLPTPVNIEGKTAAQRGGPPAVPACGGPVGAGRRAGAARCSEAGRAQPVCG